MIALHDLILHERRWDGRKIHLIFALWADKIHTLKILEEYNESMQTPQENAPKLAKAIGIPTLVLKREDLHPFGSHKGRSIPFMMQTYAAQGVRNFVISSSGNAAIAAASALPAGCTLKIFVGKHIDSHKLETLNTKCSTQNALTIEQVEHPKQHAFQEAKKAGVINLRQSMDDAALSGYASLAEELKKIPNLQSIFIPTSSGTTAQALGQNLPGVEIHIVQTEAVHPMAKMFDKNFTPAENSLGSAIVDKIAHRKNAIVKIIKKSDGSGWIVSDALIRDAMKLFPASPNSALSIAGLKKAVQSGRTFSGAVVCLLTGP